MGKKMKVVKPKRQPAPSFLEKKSKKISKKKVTFLPIGYKSYYPTTPKPLWEGGTSDKKREDFEGVTGEKEIKKEGRRKGKKGKKEGNYPYIVSLFNIGPYDCKKCLLKREELKINSWP